MKQKTHLLAILCILLQCTFFGIGDPVAKSAYKVISVYSLLTVRYGIGVVFLLLIFGKRIWADLKNCNIKRLVLPAICLASSSLIMNVALGITAATSVAFLRSTSTIMTPLLALAVLKKPYSAKHIPILVCVIIGFYLFCNPGGSLAFGLGEVLALCSAFMTAGSLVFAQKAMKTVSPITMTTVQAATTTVMTFLAGMITEGGIDLHAATPKLWAAILYLAIVCAVGGYLLQNLALRWIPSGTVSLLQCMHPIMTAVFAFFILHERLSTQGLIGAMIIIGCVVAENIVSGRENRAMRNA